MTNAEGSCLGLFEGTVLAFAGRTEEKHKK